MLPESFRLIQGLSCPLDVWYLPYGAWSRGIFIPGLEILLCCLRAFKKKESSYWFSTVNPIVVTVYKMQYFIMPKGNLMLII